MGLYKLRCEFGKYFTLQSLTYYLGIIKLIMERKMPIYEYVCPACDVKFELLRPLSQATEAADCPKCHHSAERVLSRFASFSTNEDGFTSPIGGDFCSSCSADSCDTCNI